MAARRINVGDYAPELENIRMPLVDLIWCEGKGPKDYLWVYDVVTMKFRFITSVISSDWQTIMFSVHEPQLLRYRLKALILDESIRILRIEQLANVTILEIKNAIRSTPIPPDRNDANLRHRTFYNSIIDRAISTTQPGAFKRFFNTIAGGSTIKLYDEILHQQLRVLNEVEPEEAQQYA